MKRVLFLGCSGLILAACESTGGGGSTAGSASSPPTSDLVGARAAGGETQMMARGFTSARTQGLTTYWWHAPSGTCVSTTTGDGRYQSVLTVAPSSCGY